MRRSVLALMCLSVLPAAAQVESVTVNANAVPGIWKLTRPNYIGKDGLFGAWKCGPARDTFCRLEQAGDELIHHCLAAGEGSATISGSHIHFAWGSMMARLAIDGEFQSDASFSGHTVVKLAGISAADPALSSGVKINPARQPGDEAGKADLLRVILSDGLARLPHDTRVNDSLPDRTKLGNVEAIFYLGQQVRSERPGRTPTDFFTVYAIEFGNGERICGLHQRDGGILDAFQCA